MGVAVFAMARKLAILIFRLLKFGQAYLDKGVEAYEERFRQRRVMACQEMAKSLGFMLGQRQLQTRVDDNYISARIVDVPVR